MDVLISGASVAGPVLAYWLRRRGFFPVVVERTPRPRLGLGGHAVDLFEPAMEVASRMGLVSALREARTESELLVLERPGRPAAELRLNAVVPAFDDDKHVEILRGELATILHGVTRDDVEYRFGDSIRTLAEDATGVDVTFESGRLDGSTWWWVPTVFIRGSGSWCSAPNPSSDTTSAGTSPCSRCRITAGSSGRSSSTWM